MVSGQQFIEASCDRLAEFGRESFVDHGRGVVFATLDRETGIGALVYVPLYKCERSSRLFGAALDVVRTYDVMKEVVAVVGRDGQLETGAVISAEFKVISRRLNRPDAGEHAN